MRIEALRTHLTCLALPALIAWPAAGLRAADEVARGAIVASAEVRARSAVHVSSDVLQFDVPDGGMPAVAAVRFKAGVRAASDADVQLLVSVTASPAVAVTILPMDGGTDGPPAPLGSAPVKRTLTDSNDTSAQVLLGSMRLRGEADDFVQGPAALRGEMQPCAGVSRFAPGRAATRPGPWRLLRARGGRGTVW